MKAKYSILSVPQNFPTLWSLPTVNSTIFKPWSCLGVNSFFYYVQSQ